MACEGKGGAFVTIGGSGRSVAKAMTGLIATSIAASATLRGADVRKLDAMILCLGSICGACALNPRGRSKEKLGQQRLPYLTKTKMRWFSAVDAEMRQRISNEQIAK